MRAFRVLREKDVNGDNDFDDPGDITFRYNVIAPVALQGPSPLNVMPLPMKRVNNDVDVSEQGSHRDKR